MKLFYKLSSTIALIIAFFLLPLTNAFAASGTFTASSPSYDSGTEVLQFHIAGVSPSNTFILNWVGICADTACNSDSTQFWGDNTDSYTDPMTITATTLAHNSYRPSNGTVYLKFVTYDGVNSNEYISQACSYTSPATITCPTSTPTPTGSVLAAYHINPTSQAKMVTMTTGATSSFLSLFESNWPGIITLVITIIAFFFVWRLIKSTLKRGRR